MRTRLQVQLQVRAGKSIWAALMLASAAGLASGQAAAELARPASYEGLTAVDLQPGQAPRFVNGVSELSGAEGRHAERLPLQLRGAVEKVKKTGSSRRRRAY